MSSFLSGLQIPVVTKYLLIINVAVHVIIFLTSCPLGYFSISAIDVAESHQFYRIVSAAFVHNGIFHIFMNMSSLVSLGNNLENHLGRIVCIIAALLFLVLTRGFQYVISFCETLSLI